MREKQVKFYVAVNKKDPQKFLCVTAKKEEAIEYIIQHFKLLKFEHFKMWCDIRGFNPADDLVWFKYYNEVISKEEKNDYLVHKIGYTLSNLSAILRMFSGCFPIGCNFDTPTEYEYLEDKLKRLNAVLSNPEIREEISKSLEAYKQLWE